MTPILPNKPEADAVVEAFLDACPTPTAAQVAEWSALHPALASDFTGIFECSEAMARYGIGNGPTPAETAADERHADALFAQLVSPRPDARTLQDLTIDAATDVPALARALDIDRPILADLYGGRILLPVGGRLVASLAAALKVGRGAVEAAIGNAYEAPQLGHAKSDGAPTIVRRSWREVLEASSLSDERKAYWLEDG